MKKPSKQEALEAIKTIIEYIGDDPTREGLVGTPERVIKSYDEIYAGYKKNPHDVINSIFFEKANFHDFVILKDIKFTSICEHHMLPIIGTVDVAYIPDDSIVGISKLARVVDVISKKLQIQEKMTVEIAETIQEKLKPLGVAVKISALHSCMSMRGVKQDGSLMETMHFTGVFLSNQKNRQEFFSRIKK